jgi:hypothetical protein
MALTYTNFSSFEEVVKHYENIKPMRGAANAGKDIRPIGDRKRKYERIIKINDNCYVLTDGFHLGDKYFRWQRPSDGGNTEKQMLFYAPIVWRKHKDGSTTVRIQNGAGPYNHNRRYAFLSRHTPRGLLFIQTQQGKQYISAGGMNSDHIYLAKVRTMPKEEIAEKKRILAGQKAAGLSPWTVKYLARGLAWRQVKDDNAALVFKLEGGNWKHDPSTGVAEKSNTPRVNKLTKAKFKGHINEFFEWGMTMSPLLPLDDYNYTRGLTVEFSKAAVQDYPYSEIRLSNRTYEPTLVRKILQDEYHPARLAMWVTFAHACTDGWGFNTEYLCKTAQTKEDVARVRSRFNLYINKIAGFLETK